MGRWVGGWGYLCSRIVDVWGCDVGDWRMEGKEWGEMDYASCSVALRVWLLVVSRME